jgi:hypothetical protein
VLVSSAAAGQSCDVFASLGWYETRGRVISETALKHTMRYLTSRGSGSQATTFTGLRPGPNLVLPDIEDERQRSFLASVGDLSDDEAHSRYEEWEYSGRVSSQLLAAVRGCVSSAQVRAFVKYDGRPDEYNLVVDLGEADTATTVKFEIPSGHSCRQEGKDLTGSVSLRVSPTIVRAFALCTRPTRDTWRPISVSGTPTRPQESVLVVAQNFREGAPRQSDAAQPPACPPQARHEAVLVAGEDDGDMLCDGRFFLMLTSVDGRAGLASNCHLRIARHDGATAYTFTNVLSFPTGGPASVSEYVPSMRMVVVVELTRIEIGAARYVPPKCSVTVSVGDKK